MKPSFFEMGTNLMERGTLGWPGDAENFFLRFSHRDGVPIISARVFGPQGTLLFELVENELTRRSPGHYRRIGFHNGWRIVDEERHDILEIQTEECDTPMGRGLVTHINGEFYDKDKNVVAKATSKGLMTCACPLTMG